jgi:demethylmenaquinone methyltransferase/2-methoxy-6-polyprenyl-1,4-benzoquinol methylase
MGTLPEIARRVSSNPDAYVYLAESIRAWPDQAGLALKVGANGWESVKWRNLTGGIVALHRAIRTDSQVRSTSPNQVSEASSTLHGE